MNQSITKKIPLFKIEMWFTSLLVLFMIVIFSNPFIACKSPVAQTLETQFQKKITSLYDQNKEAVGVLMHVESPDQGISWTGAVGHSDSIAKTELAREQPVLIASNTKPYVAAAIIRLVEIGALTLDQSLAELLRIPLKKLFTKDGYDLDKITIRHLLSHTSGIADYVDDAYFDFVNENPTYTWSREEQIQRTIEIGSPLFDAGTDFNYGDINFILLTDIIEQKTNKPFYEAMRELLKFEALNLNQTWFKDLEKYPKQTLPLAHQYSENHGWDSYELNPSWDLYGGGGIASTVKDAALFFQYLFQGKIIEDQTLLNEMYQFVLPKEKSNYCLGIRNFTFPNFTAYYHGGFWGTDVAYCPETNSTIAVFTLQKAKRNEFAELSIEFMKDLLPPDLELKDATVTSDYELFKAKDAIATLVLFPGGGATAKQTRQEFDILNKAKANNVSVLLMNFNRHLWIDESQTKELAELLERTFKENNLSTDKVIIGGMSIGGNVALSLSNHLKQQKSEVTPKGVFIVDSPIDLNALYNNALVDMENTSFSDQRLAEPRWITNHFEEEFGEKNLVNQIQKVSPFTHSEQHINIPYLKDCNLRFYTEPDAEWWIEHRQTAYENTNAHMIQEIEKLLKLNKWTNVELIETEGKGYRSNGDRHPHSWSIVDVNNLIKWTETF